jgi:hypothetical protein
MKARKKRARGVSGVSPQESTMTDYLGFESSEPGGVGKISFEASNNRHSICNITQKKNLKNAVTPGVVSRSKEGSIFETASL